jgi:hypothetical protein
MPASIPLAYWLQPQPEHASETNRLREHRVHYSKACCCQYDTTVFLRRQFLHVSLIWHLLRSNTPIGKRTAEKSRELPLDYLTFLLGRSDHRHLQILSKLLTSKVFRCVIAPFSSFIHISFINPGDGLCSPSTLSVRFSAPGSRVVLPNGTPARDSAGPFQIIVAGCAKIVDPAFASFTS